MNTTTTPEPVRSHTRTSRQATLAAALSPYFALVMWGLMVAAVFNYELALESYEFPDTDQSLSGLVYVLPIGGAMLMGLVYLPLSLIVAVNGSATAARIASGLSVVLGLGLSLYTYFGISGIGSRAQFPAVLAACTFIVPAVALALVALRSGEIEA